MKNILLVFSLAFFLFSCSSDVDPLLEVKVITTQSDLFEDVQIDLSYFGLAHGDTANGANGESIIQEWNGTSFTNDLAQQDTTIVLNRFHWSMDLYGVDPNFSFDLKINGINTFVNVPYKEALLLDEPITLEDDELYEIIITIDTDKAFTTTTDPISLNWDHVSVMAFKK